MNRRSALAFAIAGAFLALAPAQAATATGKLRAMEHVDIAAPPAKVWSIIQNFADMSWHPAVKKSSATKANEVGSVRTLDLGGPLLVEQLTRYDATKMLYGYKITADPANVKTLPVTRYTSTIMVRPGSDGGSKVIWRGRFLRADPSATPAAGQDDDSAVKAVTGVYRGGLDNLKKLAEAK